MTTTMQMAEVTVGRIVHYTRMGDGRHLAAIVTRVLEPEAPKFAARVNLVVFNDDDRKPGVGIFAAKYSKDPVPGTWHWPERAGVMVDG